MPRLSFSDTSKKGLGSLSCTVYSKCMDLVAFTFLATVTLACAAFFAALCYAVEARFEDTLSLCAAQLEIAELGASDAWKARALRPRKAHLFCAVVDVGALWDAPRARAQLALAGLASLQGALASAQGTSLQGAIAQGETFTAYRYRAFVGHAEWIAHRCADMEQRPWEGAPVDGSTRTLPVSGSEEAPPFGATVERPILSLVLAQTAPNAAPMSHPFERRVRRDSGVQVRGAGEAEGLRVDAWGRHERPRRLSASELYALRAPALQSAS